MARVFEVLLVMQLNSYVHWGPSSEAPAQTGKGLHPDDECACPSEEDVPAMLISYCTCVHTVVAFYRQLRLSCDVYFICVERKK